MKIDLEHINFKIVIACFLIIFLIVFYPLYKNSSLREEIESLHETISNLETQLESEQEDSADYKDLIRDIQFRSEDHLTVLYLYFEEHDATFSEARDAFNSLDKILSTQY